MEQPIQGVETDRSVIVGVNGTVESGAALRWASRLEQFAPVVPATAWAYPPWAVGRPPKGAPVAYPEAEFIKRSKRLAVDVLQSQLGPERRDHIIREGAAGPTLVALTESACLLVIGARNRRAPAKTFGRSATRHCIAHSSCPVALVPARRAQLDRKRRVVVGVDGSAESLAALEWALRHEPQDSSIHAVQAMAADQVEIAVTGNEQESMRELQNLVDRTTNNVAEGTSAATVVPIVESGKPAEVLRRHADGAELLVVGARGRGALAHALVGSVTTSLADHPTTVTVVVPAVHPSGE